MLLVNSHNAESRKRKRDLRIRIARGRRRIDRRAQSLTYEANRLRSWRTYVRHFPMAGLVVGLGLGMSLSAGINAGGWSRWLGQRLVRRGTLLFSQRFFSELRQFWDETRPHRDTAAEPEAADPTATEPDEPQRP